jgi:hypothetical protein
LPSPEIVDRVLGRDRGVLEQIANDIDWPTQYPRVLAAARGIYRGQAPGVPTWSGYRQMSRVDISHPQARSRRAHDSTRFTHGLVMVTRPGLDQLLNEARGGPGRPYGEPGNRNLPRQTHQHLLAMFTRGTLTLGPENIS